MSTQVNYPTAKLLKEKGYDKPCGLLYDNNGVLSGTKMSMGGNPNNYINKYSAPTITEVVVWLYEKYRIWVFVADAGGFGYTIQFLNTDGDSEISGLHEYEEPIEAYEAAFEYVLNNLI